MRGGILRCASLLRQCYLAAVHGFNGSLLFDPMKRNSPLIIFFLIFFPVSVHAYFEGSVQGARSQAMGGAFVALGDDGSTLFHNPAGLAGIGSVCLYGDYGNTSGCRERGEAKIDVVFPAGMTVFGAGWQRLGLEGAPTENLFIAGVARRILKGARGSFLSVGASFRLWRLSCESICGSGARSSTGSEATGDFGVMLRPVPVLSLGYSVENIREVDLDITDNGSARRRVSRWGISCFLEKTVIVSFEQEHLPGRVVRHYGFSLRTSVPLELMAGFSDENVSGGARWSSDHIRVTVSFISCDDLGIDARASLEILFNRTGNGPAM